MAIIDLTGKRFGRWVVEHLCADSGNVKFWSCVCDCGTRRRVFGGDLKRGGSKSCGCLMRDIKAAGWRSHDMSRHPAYRNWIGAKMRCENAGNEGYWEYGGRGITVSDQWQSFDVFWRDMGPSWRPGLTLDRLDVDGNYEAGNCRWATPREQAHNRRDNRYIQTPRGPMNVTQAAEAFGISRVTISSRLRAGWPQSRLLDPPAFTPKWHKLSS
jgi:hypothetical protein